MVYVDEYIPVYTEFYSYDETTYNAKTKVNTTTTKNDAYYYPVFAQVGQDGSFWGAMHEKMYAKIVGNYEFINNGGYPREALDVLLGAPTLDIYFGDFGWAYDDYMSEYSPEDLYNIIRDCEENQFPAVAAIFDDWGAYNLPGNHAYTVLGAW